MNQDRKAAERLDRYIDASLRGEQTQTENPLLDRLLATAQGIEAGPTVREKVTRSMNTNSVRPRRFRWAAVAAALALLVLAFVTIPPLRGLARDIVNVFAVQPTDQDPGLLPTVTPPAGVVPAGPAAPLRPEPSTGLALEEVRAQVAASTDITFDVNVPAFLPSGLAFDAGTVDGFGRMVQLIYVSDDRLSTLFLRMFDLANPNPAVEVTIPLGASSTIEEVKIGGGTGQYARGAYGVDGAWDPSAPVQTLAWRGGDVLYMITTYEQGPKISQGDLVAMAESIGR